MGNDKQVRGADRPRTKVELWMSATPERVFEIMSDPWLLPVWVVGATHIRDVDEEWPAPQSKVHHQVGAWPFAISDTTEVIECEPAKKLVLLGRVFPLGEAYIELTVRADGGGSVVCMSEAPSDGPARALDNWLQRKLLAARNRESLARLRDIVENRHEGSEPGT